MVHTLRQCWVMACGLALVMVSSNLEAQGSSVAVSGPPPPTDPPIVTRPEVRSGPTRDQIAAAMQPTARVIHQNGYATVSCRVAATGTAEDCQLEQESPTGRGFGPAAMKMTSLFRLRPKTVDGVPQDDGSITFVVVFPAQR
jgi:periplasmic protein TonB